MAGSAALADVAQRFGVDLPVDSYDTLGGYMFGELKRLPAVGDEVPFPGGHAQVLSMDKRRVTRVSVTSTAVVVPDENDDVTASPSKPPPESVPPKD